MNENLVANQAIDSIASAFERMNAFATSLYSKKSWANPVTTADICQYEDGWKLEKYVESVIDSNKGLTASWAIEVSFKNDAWLISTNTSVSHGDYYEDIDLLEVGSIDELGQKLEEAVTNLTHTISPGAPFLKEIERLKLLR